MVQRANRMLIQTPPQMIQRVSSLKLISKDPHNRYDLHHFTSGHRQPSPSRTQMSLHYSPAASRREETFHETRGPPPSLSHRWWCIDFTQENGTEADYTV